MAETNKLSQEQRQELARRVRDGDSYASIARDLGVTLQGVSFHARKLVGPKKIRKLTDEQCEEIAVRFEAGETATQLARGFGVSLSAARKAIERSTGNKPGRHRRSRGVSPPLSISERAYMAALVDGEGCISRAVSGSGERRGWQVTITNTSEDLYRSLAPMGGRFYFPKRQLSFVEGKDLREQVWVWKITAAWDVYRFLSAIEPFMRIKREKALTALGEISLRFGRPPAPPNESAAAAAAVIDGAVCAALKTVVGSEDVAPPRRLRRGS